MLISPHLPFLSPLALRPCRFRLFQLLGSAVSVQMGDYFPIQTRCIKVQ